MTGHNMDHARAFLFEIAKNNYTIPSSDMGMRQLVLVIYQVECIDVHSVLTQNLPHKLLQNQTYISK